MKRIYVELKLVNYGQLEAVAMGLIKPEEVRSVTLKGRIDTGCTHLALPEDIANQLALRKLEKTKDSSEKPPLCHSELVSESPCPRVAEMPKQVRHDRKKSFSAKSRSRM